MAIEDALKKSLAKNPGSRFGSAADFAAALEGASIQGVAALLPPEIRSHSDFRQRFIAVLPFDNMSADPENEYFAEGITEDIIAQLSKIQSLKVMSRTSTARYKSGTRSLPEIGRELGVSHILEGSVRRVGSTVRIVAQLIDAGKDQHVWAETWDRDITHLFAIQSEVAQQIARSLHARLTPTEQIRISKKPTDDIEAYNLYLMGRHHYNKVTPDDFSKAVDCFKEASDRDPNFSLALASLAEAYQYLGMGYWGVRPHDVHPEAFTLATKAEAIDPANASAHAALGLYHDWYCFDWDKGGAELARAVELYPSGSMLRLYYAMHLCAIGEFDQAMVHREIACQLDPSAMAIRGNATWLLYLARRMDEAVEECRIIRRIDPSSSYAAFSHGLVCAQGGDKQEAIAAFRDAAKLGEGISLYVVTLAYGLAVGGEHEEARRILGDLERRAKTEFIWPLGLALIHAHLGEESIALDYLEKAYEERVGWMLMITREPALDVLRASPRFQTLAKKIGPANAS
jgi:TolB-like protein/tetratricopeptide (TPR) repeat protein